MGVAKGRLYQWVWPRAGSINGCGHGQVLSVGVAKGRLYQWVWPRAISGCGLGQALSMGVGHCVMHAWMDAVCCNISISMLVFEIFAICHGLEL